MHKLLKASVAIATILILAACGESTKTVQSKDGLFEIIISEQYQDVMDKRDAAVAVRLESAPAENITLLQAKEGDITNDLLYAVTIEIPEDVQVTLPDFEKMMYEQMNQIKEIVDFKVKSIEGSNTELLYTAQTNVSESPYYEFCRVSVENQITTICIGTRQDPKGAEKAIESIHFLK